MAKVDYCLAADNSFVIKNYNSAPTFSSFFPGIAGKFGCPMWVFYTNRGQCLTSAGVQDKDGALIEFQPANKAYRTVTLSGFRTFLKVDGVYYEPYCERSHYKKEMRISLDGLKLIESNPKLKIKIETTFFTIPNEHFPALAKITKIINLSGKPKQIEIIDGLPIVIPFGFANDMLKRISQTIEAWCAVENLENGAPFYRLKVLPDDAAETKLIEKGNFFTSFISLGKGKIIPVNYIVNPATVFGETSSLEFPDAFINVKDFHLPASQLTCGFMPSAMSHKKLVLAAKSDFEVCSVLGQIESIECLNQTERLINNRKYFEDKYNENLQLISDLCSQLDVNSSAKTFDLYTRQTFLDNVMRGGLPIDLDGKVFYIYFRKHGDMERDYNDFKLMPNYFSQGNGNYRDINQNRRNDAFINPNAAEHNIERFFDLIQLDGFNPLVVIGSRYYLKSAKEAASLVKKHLKNPPPDLAFQLVKPFIFGRLLKGLDDCHIAYLTNREDFACELLSLSTIEQDAAHGEGFWIDHFTYNTDLLESYEAIFPEKINDLLFNRKSFTFFDNDHIILDRKDKYAISGGKVRQFHAVKADQEKQALISSRTSDNNLMRADFGRGEVYYTTLTVKILSLLANKAASFDAAGIGLEMEADKPAWYDALNGLPSLLGSSLSETFELKRLAKYALDRLPPDLPSQLPEEVNEFIGRLNRALEAFFAGGDSFAYWDDSNTAKEIFRNKVRLGVSGNEKNLSSENISFFLKNIIKKCDWGIALCLKKYKNYYTYFINDVVEHAVENGKVAAKKFSQKPLPLFLEGFVHALKVENDKKIYRLVRQSPLFDKKLKMYKVNASLADAPVEIGRAKVFTPGWLENESIWLHMEYKFLLELLKAGLYKEFFADFKKVLIPFMDPETYKRSILENSSFIVSSANPNHSNHGRGFVARLSGGAAEFIDMWIFMMTGKSIFTLDNNGKLCFKLAPILPGWLFKKGKLIFTLLGSIKVTYINPKNKNTFDGGASPVSYKLELEDKEVEIKSPVIGEPYASLIRERKVKRILVNLA